MAAQGYSTAVSRNLIRAAQGMLEHAQPITVLGDFGSQKEMPQKNTDTLVFRRTLPFGATTAGITVGNMTQYQGAPVINAPDFVIGEGVTPNANTISFQDISVTLQNFGVLYKFTSKTELMYEDDVPAEMQKQTGEALAEVLELVRYGVYKAGTSVVYANGSSRAVVNTSISLNRLRQAQRVLDSNRAKKVTQRLAAGVNFGTAPVQPAYVVFHHTDCNADVRNLPNFTRVEEYGSFKPIHDMEIGACEEFRFIASPLLLPFLAAGSATLNGSLSRAGSNVDVYPYLVIGEDAWGSIALKGMSAISPTIIPSNVKNHANPMGLFGYVGASCWYNAVRLNEAWTIRIEAAVSDLS